MGNFIDICNDNLNYKKNLNCEIKQKDTCELENICKSEDYNYMGFKSKEMFVMFIGTCHT